ncbi:MAG: UvrD-helicase domain-containing protein, partial [Tissierellia bacterium]|nr:UvrD-helicase domain-containing protein [Tissierellia bacterium]
PGNILAITFTNKAANEMKERVEYLLDGNTDYMWMGTFHSICVRILRYNIEKIGYGKSFSIYDRDDQITLMKECIKEMDLDKEVYKERAIINTISSLKDKMIEPGTYIKENYSSLYSRNVGELYALYQRKLKGNNALDFDDLILKTVELFRTDPDTLDYYQKKFQYIFVDEFQDTNKIQYELVWLLSQGYKNLCVVGDDDQSIYGWRGADISNILNFERDFSNTKTIKLEQNYRSTQNILDVANHVIKNNSERKDKKLWTANDTGEQVIVENVVDSQEEAYFVANKIEELRAEGYNYSDFAILYRTNAQSRNFEEIFMRKNIPYKLVGGLKFYDRREIKDIVAYLRVIQNPVDDISLKRIINVPRRGIGNVSMEKVEDYANNMSISMYDAINEVENIPGLGARAKNSLEDFAKMINKLMDSVDNMEIREFIELVLLETGYVEELQKEDSIESKTRLENIGEFLSVAVDFDVNNPEGSLEDFLSGISLLSDVDKTQDVDNSITMLTVHSAKGLEFPIVFMVGMEEGLFPISRALESEDELEEERRLCYVAITRAEKLLFITHAKIRTIYGSVNYCLPSRFIDEMPSDLILNKGGTNKSIRVNGDNEKFKLIEIRDYRDRKEKTKVEIPKPRNKVEKGELKVGTKVKHNKWGIGMVVMIKDRDDGDQEITIAFDDNIGLKRLLMSMAPIEIVR